MNDNLNVCLKTLLSKELPQEWIADLSELTTCHGPAVFIRVESEPKAENKRQLICLVELKKADLNIVIITPNATAKNVLMVIKSLKKIVSTNLLTFHGYCFIISECPLNCPSCPLAKEFYK